jgi:hypothetical protein
MALTLLTVIRTIKETRGKTDERLQYTSVVNTTSAELADLIGIQFTLNARYQEAKRREEKEPNNETP